MAQADDKKEPQEAPTQSEETPQALDSERLNKIISERLTRERKTFEKQLQERDAKLSELAAMLAERVAPKSAEGEEEGSDAEKKWARKFKEFEKKTQEKITAVEAEREREREAARRAEEINALTTALTDEKAVNLQGALALLKDQKAFGRDKDGQIRFYVQKDGYVDEVSVGEGVKAWLETQEGRYYQAPKGAAGSGATAAKATGRGAAQTKQEQKAEAAQVLTDFFFGSRR